MIVKDARRRVKATLKVVVNALRIELRQFDENLITVTRAVGEAARARRPELRVIA